MRAILRFSALAVNRQACAPHPIRLQVIATIIVLQFTCSSSPVDNFAFSAAKVARELVQQILVVLNEIRVRLDRSLLHLEDSAVDSHTGTSDKSGSRILNGLHFNL